MTLKSLRRWAADNFIASTFQTMGQYRAALLRAIDEAIQQTFQVRVKPWMLECFGAEIAADAEERNHRFLEEALELVQACGCTRGEAHQLVDYVFSRPVGEKHQEVGGVMVTLAALCLAQSLDMHEAGETELARIWTKVAEIRAKQAAKPKHSPLPQIANQGAEASDTRESSVVCISARELLDVLELAAPDVMPEIDRDHEQMDTEMCIGRLSGSIDDDGGDSGPGLFAWYTEYPEEGVVPLRLDRDIKVSLAAMSREQSQEGGDDAR